MKRLTNLEFIERCKTDRGEKFDYSFVNFIKWHQKIKIGCNICGCYWNITPVNFITNRNGCPECKKRLHILRCQSEKLTTDIFIERSNIAHGNLYNYSKSIYINSKSKITITCEEHGDFNQMSYDHMNGIGCNKCRVKKILDTKIDKCIIRSLDQLSEFEKYKNAVWNVSETNYRKYKHKIDNLNRRGYEFNLDHVFSIQQGFTHDIEPVIIGNYTNLRIIPALENRKKHNNCDKTLEQLFEDYNNGEYRYE